MEKTLREVCEKLKVSRRAIQGYEKAGLVSASGRNQRGYLLYDKKTQERIEWIKRYQDIGFSIKEIVQIIDAPTTELRSALVVKLAELQARKAYIEKLIKLTHELIQNL